MNTSSPSHNELRELLHAMRDDQLSQAQSQRLEELASQDEEAMRLYVQAISMLANLRWAASETPEVDPTPLMLDTVDDASAVIIVEKHSSLSRRIKRYDSIHWQRHKIRFNAMTAVLTALAWIGFSYFVWFSTTPDDSRPNRSGNIQYVAEITGQYEARWAEGMPRISGHHALLSSERLNLAEGLIEITFDGGAVVVLEGPTDFVVDSSEAGTLESGKLVANVPQEAIGFAVNTPTGQVVDLGTQFGLSVDEVGQTEVHVFDGEVDAILYDRSGAEVRRLRLTKDQAARLDVLESSLELVAIDNDRFQFQDTIQDTQAARRVGLIAHYEFEDGPGSRTAVDSSGNGHTGTLEGVGAIVNDPIRGNVYQYVYNRLPTIRSFIDIDSTIPIPDLPANGGVTLAAWVYREDVRIRNINGKFAQVIGLGSSGHTPIMTLTVMNNGALQTYIEGSGTPEIQEEPTSPPGVVANEVWTHIAVTFDRAGDVAKFYVNGLQVGDVAGFDILTIGDGALDWTTACVGHVPTTDSVIGEERMFPGMIDDVRIYDEVLTASAVWSLHNNSNVLSIANEEDRLPSD